MISAPFSLFQLPKTALTPNNYPKVVADAANAFVGVSSSSISTWSLKPPQEIDAFSVSPGTIITALSVLDQYAFFYATKERKKHFLKLTNGPAITVQSEISHIYTTSSTILVVYSNLNIETFTHKLQHKWSAKEFGGKKESVVFSSLVNPETFFLVTLDGSTFNLMLFSFSSTECALLQRMELPNHGHTIWSYAEGTLFAGSKDIISLYDVLKCQKTSQISAEFSDMLAISKDSCLLAQPKKLILVDTKFQAKLAEYPIESEIKLLAFVSDAACCLTIENDNIVGFPCTPSQGSLFDSIGHGIGSIESVKYGYTDIFNFTGPVRDMRKNASQKIQQAEAEAKQILENVQNAFSEKDGTEFSKIVPYLKGSSWTECKPQTAAVTYEETDRHVDKDLIKNIVAFAFGEHGYTDFLPETVGIYLLTHPLFPTNEPQFRNIFNCLESSPLLYRQAVVTLRGASAKNIIEALSSPSEEIFSDAVTRLNEEFSYEQIVAGIKAAIAKSPKIQLNALSKLVTRLSQHPDGWTLVSPLVDTVGLHSWDAQLLHTLESKLERKIDHVRGLQSINNTISELLRSVDIDVATVTALSKSEIKRKSKQGKTHKNKQNRATEVPRYSIETLVFTEN